MGAAVGNDTDGDEDYTTLVPQVRVRSYAELPPRTTVRRVATGALAVGPSQ